MSAEAMLLLEQVDSSISLKFNSKYTNKSGITKCSNKNLKIVDALFFLIFQCIFLKCSKMFLNGNDAEFVSNPRTCCSLHKTFLIMSKPTLGN